MAAALVAEWVGCRATRLREDLLLEHAAGDAAFFAQMCEKGVIEFRGPSESPDGTPQADATIS